MNCGAHGHVWTRGWTPGTVIANGESCDCGGATWPDQSPSSCPDCEALRQSLTACQEALDLERDWRRDAQVAIFKLLARAEAAEARLLALTFQPGPSDPQAPDPPHTRPDYADCWQSGWRTGYAVARDSAEARLLAQQGEIERRLTDDVIEDALQKAAEAGEAAFFTDFDRSARDAAHRATLRRVLLRAILLEPKPHV